MNLKEMIEAKIEEMIDRNAIADRKDAFGNTPLYLMKDIALKAMMELVEANEYGNFSDITEEQWEEINQWLEWIL